MRVSSEATTCSEIWPPKSRYRPVATITSWTRAMFAAMDRPVNIEYIEMPETLRDRYQYYTCLDINKIRQAGYTAPLTTLEDAAKDYVSYLERGAHLGE